MNADRIILNRRKPKNVRKRRCSDCWEVLVAYNE